jgi:hypothetical protein
LMNIVIYMSIKIIYEVMIIWPIYKGHCRCML